MNADHLAEVRRAVATYEVKIDNLWFEMVWELAMRLNVEEEDVLEMMDQCR